MSAAGAGLGTDLDAQGVLDRLAVAKVGGAFWMPRLAERRRYRAWVRCAGSKLTSHTQALDAERGGEGAILATSLDQVRIGSRAGQIDGSPLDHLDPWSVLAQCDLVIAPEDDEIHVLALAARRPSYTLEGMALVRSGLTAEAAVARLTASSFRNPFTDASIGLVEAIDILESWRRGFEANAEIVAGLGIAAWKRDEVARMVWPGHGPLPRLRSRGRGPISIAARARGALIHWPSRSRASDREAAAAADLPLYQVEDGFIRSRGLGSDCYPPLSIVVDRLGIYYDARTPSDLEIILANHVFDPALLARAERLIDRLVGARIGKYESGGGAASLPADARRKVLVAGQVEDDLSVIASGGDVAGNLDLLRRARDHDPDAFIIYRPHPDVDAGHRKGRVDDARALEWADMVSRDGSMIGLIESVDAIHVLTSLAGFEALLRHRSVVVHGQPFYAGWGLTTDLAPPIARRGRQLQLAELVAATLILYPRYLDPVTRLPCPPEVLLDRLADGYAPRETMATRFRRFLKMMRSTPARRGS